jgi:LacI family transcriptional regulator
MTTTIASVAALAGVGVGTVSRVLNDSGAVSGSTRMRVLEAIDALDYEPSAAARALSTGRTSTIGIVAPFFTEPSVVERLRGATRRLAAAGYQVTLLDVERPEHAGAALRSLSVKGRVDGMLVVSLPPTDAQLERLAAAGIPVVLVDRRADGTPSVYIDDEAGGRLATEHLLGLGHERIAYVTSASHVYPTDERRDGALNAARRAGRGDDALHVVGVEHLNVAHGRDAGERILGLRPRPTAVFCANDLVGLGVLQVMIRHGVRVPDDMAIVGIDDIEFASAAAIPLTSVRQPRQLLGRTAADLLLAEATGDPEHVHRRVVLQPELVVRASTIGNAA